MSELIGITEAVMRLGVHPATIYRWVDRGLLKAVRDSSGKRIFTAEELDRFAREREAAK